MRELIETLPQRGRVAWIGRSPARKAAIDEVSSVRVRAGTGLDGDHHASKARAKPSKRQVTLIQAEHLPVIAAIMGLPSVPPAMLRRNLVVSGINLLSLQGRRFAIGEVVLATTGLCDPCERMEQALGPGGFNAMCMHGGITAAVLTGGTITVGDDVVALPLPEAD